MILSRTGRPLLLAAAALALVAGGAAAQIGNQSDVSGITPAGSGPFVGQYLGAGVRTENEMFSKAGGTEGFRNARVGCAVRDAERSYRDSVSSAGATAAQQAVQRLLDARPGGGDEAAVASSLAHGAPAGTPLGDAARTLAHALNGLMRDLGGCSANRSDYPEGAQWKQAIQAFNDYLRRAPDSAFSPPAPELLAAHDALLYVIERTLHPPRAS